MESHGAAEVLADAGFLGPVPRGESRYEPKMDGFR